MLLIFYFYWMYSVTTKYSHWPFCLFLVIELVQLFNEFIILRLNTISYMKYFTNCNRRLSMGKFKFSLYCLRTISSLTLSFWMCSFLFLNMTWYKELVLQLHGFFLLSVIRKLFSVFQRLAILHKSTLFL